VEAYSKVSQMLGLINRTIQFKKPLKYCFHCISLLWDRTWNMVQQYGFHSMLKINSCWKEFKIDFHECFQS